MGKKLGFLFVLVLLVSGSLLLYALLGPEQFLNDSTIIDTMIEIRSEYGMESGFSPFEVAMGDYITELGSFRGIIPESRGAIIVDSELGSAKAFYYLLKASSEAGTITGTPICNDAKINDALSFCDIAIGEAGNAIEKMESLSENELAVLRENQLEATRDYKRRAEELKIEIQSTC